MGLEGGLGGRVNRVREGDEGGREGRRVVSASCERIVKERFCFKRAVCVR